MTKLTAAITFFVLNIILVSCQKEVSNIEPAGNSNAIQGEYKFITLETKSIATVELKEGTDVEKSVTYNHYRTKNNAGTVKIDGQSFKVQQLSYQIDTVIKVLSYYNGTLENSMEMPFAFSAPPTSSTAPYKLINADSIYFSSGSMIGNNGQQQAAPAGARLKIEGDKLMLTYDLSQQKIEDIQGTSYSFATVGTTVITLQKL